MTQKPQVEPQQIDTTKEQPSKHYNELVQMSKSNNPENSKLGFGFANNQKQAYINAISDLTKKLTQNTRTINGTTTTAVELKGSFPVKDNASYGVQENGSTKSYYACVVSYEN